MATTIARPATLVGQKIRRKEDPRLITGAATYVDDIKLPGMHFACVVRSPYPAADILSIDTKPASDLPGVVAVFTGKDIGSLGPIINATQFPDPMPPVKLFTDLKVPHHTMLATDRVYYVGHPVAVVVARDRYVARDAADRVQVDYAPRPSVADPERALEPGAPLVHPDYGNNVAFRYQQSNGEVDQAFASADVVVKQRILSPRLVGCPMEPRAAVAEYKAAEGTLTLYSSTQIPHLLRTLMSLVTGVPEGKLRVVAPEVGGGFGVKADLYADEVLTCFVSMKIGKPVKWVETRRENFVATIQGRGHADFYEIAAKRDGTILAIRVKIIQDMGAYHQVLTSLIPVLSVLMLPGLYRCKTFAAEVVGAFTNCIPTDAYRGAGRPEATYCIERMVDMLAAELKMDPAELRLKNFIGDQEFPFLTGPGLLYDSGAYSQTLNKALDMVDYSSLRDEQRRLRGEGRYIGIGISTYGEICAFGPSPYTFAGGWESATVRIEPSGHVTVHTGVKPQGQGEETTFSQIVADELGVPMDDIFVVHGDTSIVQYGLGTFGSRGTAVGGTAVFYAVQQLKDKILKYGTMLLESDDVEYAGAKCICRKSGKEVSLAQIAGASYRIAKLPPAGVEPGLVATSHWEPQNFTFPFGAHICVTEVNPDTGEVSILRYVAVDDCGKIINPLIVAGQIHGGIAQGIGQALYEEAVYDETGQLLSGEFTDYTVPKAIHIPPIESYHTETPSPSNPLGVKGVGEAGAIGSPPAVVNSVIDALSPLGVRHLDMPLTPEKVWRAIQGASR